MNNKQIAIFGGTFDPVHIGHFQMVNYLLGLIFVDEVWILPSYFPPHKDYEIINSFEHRVEMLKLVFNNLKYVYISTFEKEYYKKNNKKTFTFEILEEFTKKYLSYNFNFVIGFDSIKNIYTWHKYKELLEKYHLYIFMRNDDSCKSYKECKNLIDLIYADLNISPKYNLFDTKISNISSSSIRDLFKNIEKNKIELYNYLNKDVYKYILNNNLYGT